MKTIYMVSDEVTNILINDTDFNNFLTQFYAEFGIVSSYNPSFELVSNWLRQQHNLFFYVSPQVDMDKDENTIKWYFEVEDISSPKAFMDSIFNNISGNGENKHTEYISYEDAFNEGILYVINNILK